MPLGDAMTGGPIELAHALPGRVRLKLGRLKEDASLAGELQRALGGLEGVLLVEANPWSGSLLIHYDPNRLEVLTLGSAVRAALGVPPDSVVAQLEKELTEARERCGSLEAERDQAGARIAGLEKELTEARARWAGMEKDREQLQVALDELSREAQRLTQAVSNGKVHGRSGEIEGDRQHAAPREDP